MHPNDGRVVFRSLAESRHAAVEMTQPFSITVVAGT
jgi:hypothetical protein